MSHLIQIHTVCPLVFEFSISYSLGDFFFIFSFKICKGYFCQLFGTFKRNESVWIFWVNIELLTILYITV